MDIYLVRHGHRGDDPTNPAGVQKPKGRSLDPDISIIGVKQAKQTGQRLKGLGIKAIYSSPFLRAVHTAHHIAEALELKVRIEWGLSEALGPLYKDWPGTIPPIKLARMFPTVDPDFPPTGILPNCPEKDYWESHGRYHEAVLKLLERHSNENILLVTHGAGVCSIPPALAGWEGYSGRPFLASVTKLHRDDAGKWTIGLNGDTSHLEYVRI